MFSISDFQATMNKHGVSSTTLFVVRINNIPAALADDIDARELQFFCRTADIPSMGIITREHRDQGFGAMQRMPGGLGLSPLQTVFMVDSNHAVLKFFHRWMQSIINYDQSAGPISSVDDMLPYEMSYPSDYEVDITVEVYSKDDPTHKYVYNFFRCYPTDLGTISVAWESYDSIMLLPVSFTFQTMSTDGTQKGSCQLGDGRAFGMIDLLAGLLSGSDVKGITRNTPIQDMINTLTTVGRYF